MYRLTKIEINFGKPAKGELHVENCQNCDTAPLAGTVTTTFRDDNHANLPDIAKKVNAEEESHIAGVCDRCLNLVKAALSLGTVVVER